MTGTCQFVHQGFEKWCRDLVDVAADARASKTHGAGSSITTLELIDSSWCFSSVYHARSFNPLLCRWWHLLQRYWRQLPDDWRGVFFINKKSGTQQSLGNMFGLFSKFLEGDLLPIAACHCRALLRWPSTLFPRKGFWLAPWPPQQMVARRQGRLRWAKRLKSDTIRASLLPFCRVAVGAAAVPNSFTWGEAAHSASGSV